MPGFSDQPSPGSGRPLPTSGVVFAGFVALAVAMGIGRFAFTPILPVMRHEGALSPAGAAWLASANYTGYLVGAVLPLLVSIRTDRGIRWGLVIICLGTGAMGFEHSFGWWIVLRAVTGIGNAWVLIFVSAWCVGYFKQVGRPASAGTVFAGVGAGILLAGLLCLGFMKAKATSAQMWVGLGSLAIVLTALVWPLTCVIPTNKPRPRNVPKWNWEAGRLILCYGVFGFSYIIPATFLPAMAQKLVSDAEVFGWMWPAFGAAAFASTLVAGGASKRLGNRRLWIACHFLMALGVALPALWHHLSAIAAAALLVGGTFMVISMVAIQEAEQIAARNPTSLIAAMTTAFATGQVLGPNFANQLRNVRDEFAGALLFAAFLLLLSAGILIRQRPAKFLKANKVDGFIRQI